MRKALLFFLLTVAGIAAAEDPNLQRGFSPGKMYDLLGLDSVNTLNGNLNLRIPLGQKYTAGPILQYQFMLSYNSKIWEFEYLQGERPPTDPRKRPVPDTRSNAGFGWRLSLGELYKPKVVSYQPPSTGWTYVAPDGSSHEFPTIADAPDQVVTDDGSFLRLRDVADDDANQPAYEIDFPDGSIHRFVFENEDKPNARLTKISDRYGNWVKIAYSAAAWTVTDGYGSTTARTHTITIEDVSGDYNQENYKTRPTELKLAAADDDGVATYTLAYSDELHVPVGHCAGNGTDLPDAILPMLASIEQPDGTKYVPSYQLYEMEACTSGVIQELKLPTLGSIAWQHGVYELSFQECVKVSEGDSELGWYGSYAGVRTRTLKNESGVAVETRSYTPNLVMRAIAQQQCGSTAGDQVYAMLPPQEFQNTVTVTVPESGIDKTLEKTIYYFSVFPAYANATEYGDGFIGVEYGLPFTRRASNGGRFLSSQTYSCSDGTCSPATFVRTNYLLYDYDIGGLFLSKATSPRVLGQRTVFNGDACAGTGCLYYTDTANSRYDNYGHFRESTVTSNLGGSSRTVNTEYNPDTSTWFLGRVVSSNVVENDVTTQRMIYTYDAAGQMKSRRILKGATAGTGDLLSVTCRDARGYVTSVKWLGGDGKTPPADSTDLCAATATPGTKEYEIVHEYPSGDGFRTWHKAHYSGLSSFNIADEEFNANTGSVTKTKDSAGLATTYAYDDMGRLASISPPGAASTTFTYRNASSTETARVTSKTGSATAAEQTYDYDALGRLFREKRLMPDASWALRKTEYRGGSETKFVSEWVTLSATGDEKLVTPTIGTAFEYDQFGRTTKVTAADLKVATTTYTNGGAREVKRKQTIATPSGEQEVTVTETYDMYGKLVSVSEPAGPTSATSPNGGTVKTEYEYDTDGKLTKVTMTPPTGAAQVRTFTYDTRGLLTAETHPEKSLAIGYGSFDARGHAWTATDADKTISFDYDKAERLTKVSNASGSALKEFTFGTSADCTYCNGKLRKAIRHNNLPGLSDHTVTETYTYGANGLPSMRETLVERSGSQMQKFSQDFAYDELLALDRVDYPTCSLQSCSTTNGLTSVDHTRTRGLLTRVEGFASITYHPSGMVYEVTRTTTPAMTDRYDADSSMARPSKITFSGATACTVPSNPSINAPAFVCSGSTANQASVSSPQNGVTYAWTIQNGTLPSTTGTTVSFTAGTNGQPVTLTATATNACGTATSAPKTVAIPQATITSANTTINAGGSAYTDVTLTGTPPWRLTWSDNDTISSNITTSPFRRQVTPSATATYTLTGATDATSCNLIRSGSTTVTVRPPAPASITAQATDRTVQITWPQVNVSGASYDVERADSLSSPSWYPVAIATSQQQPVTDTVPVDASGARHAYIYRVRTVAADGTRSADGPVDYAVTAASMYPSGSIVARSTFVQAQHIVELRRGIDALRTLVSLPQVFTSQAAPSGWVYATQFTALLAPLDEARAKFGYGAFVHANGIAQPGLGVLIKAEHITQLREVLQ
jgi:YD repeat-containing protein